MARTSEEFQRFLERLDPDPQAAGDAYERMRARLIRYFAWEACARSEDWADEVLDRVALRVAAGDEVRNVPAFVNGVARLVLLEAKRTERREQPLDVMPLQAETEFSEDREKLARALEECLGQLPSASRELILGYYDGNSSQHIRNRQRLAARLQLSLNALRNRALRVRDTLERCLDGRLKQDESRNSRTKKGSSTR